MSLEQAAANEEAVPDENEVQAETETDPAQVPLVVAKRQAPELTADCIVYRYGTLATSVEVVRTSKQLFPIMLVWAFVPYFMMLISVFLSFRGH